MKLANYLALLLCFVAVIGIPAVPALASEKEREVYLLELVEHLQSEQWSKAYPLFGKIEELTEARNLEPDNALLYYHGEVAFKLGKLMEASSYFGRYLVAAGESGTYATDALNYMAEISNQMEVSGAENTSEERIRKENALLWLLDNLKGKEIAVCINPDSGKVHEWRIGKIGGVSRINDCSFIMEGEYSRTIDIRSVTISLANDSRGGPKQVIWDPDPDICRSNAITSVSADTDEYERRLNAYKSNYCSN